MVRRQMTVTLWKQQDGSIVKCSLNVYEWNEEPSKGIERPILSELSKHDVEYLIWILARAREKMKYTEDEPPS